MPQDGDGRVGLDGGKGNIRPVQYVGDVVPGRVVIKILAAGSGAPRLNVFHACIESSGFGVDRLQKRGRNLTLDLATECFQEFAVLLAGSTASFSLAARTDFDRSK